MWAGQDDTQRFKTRCVPLTWRACVRAHSRSHARTRARARLARSLFRSPLSIFFLLTVARHDIQRLCLSPCKRPVRRPGAISRRSVRDSCPARSTFESFIVEGAPHERSGNGNYCLINMNIELSGKIECYPPRESMRSLCLLNFNSALFSTISQNIPPPSLSLSKKKKKKKTFYHFSSTIYPLYLFCIVRFLYRETGRGTPRTCTCWSRFRLCFGTYAPFYPPSFPPFFSLAALPIDRPPRGRIIHLTVVIMTWC